MKLDPKSIIVTCQGPNKEPFVQEAELLFKSLKKYGGCLAETKKLVCFSKDVSDNQIQKFSELGVKVRIIEDVDARCKHASKIQNLSIFKDEDFEFLVVLDTDVVITNDFSLFLDEQSIGAKPVDQDPLSLEEWEHLFGYFGLDLPQERYLTSFNMKETIPYFNSGVLLIPRKFVAKLYEVWKSYVYKLLDSYKDLPEIEKHSFFTDQFALSLALKDAKIPHNALPLEMNFPTHENIHKKMNPNQMDPYLIHYHHKFSNEKEILHCSYDNINVIIDKINQKIIK